MTRCERIQRELVPYLDGDLGPSAQELVAAHLRTCTECATALAGLSEVCALLDAERDLAVPVELEGEVIRRIRRLEERPTRGAWGLPVALAAGVAGFVALAAWATLDRQGPDATPQQQMVMAPPAPTPLKASGATTPPEPRIVVATADPVAEHVPSESDTDQAPAEISRAAALPLVSPDPIPSDLLDALDLFVHFPIIRDLERFEHFEAIWTASESESEDDGKTRGG